MTRAEELQQRLDFIAPQCKKIWDEYMNKALENIPYNVAWKWYKNQPVIQEEERLENELRRIKEAEYEPIPDYGDHMTFNEFVGMCKSGGFIDDDGEGCYATKDKMTNISVYPSDIRSGNYRTDFTHVVWFNK